MEGNGPSGGEPRPLGFLMASTSAHALDAILARIWGLEPASVHTLAVAAGLGLLPPLDRIEVVGARPDDLRPVPSWRLARPAPLRGFGEPAWLTPLFDRLLSLRPVVDPNRCAACGECVQVCAAEAMALAPDGSPGPRLSIDRERCIACFCCQEMCPEGAIRASAGPLARLLRLGAR
jgi:NAD-dependent dihydropyrimidine dehydrogenase PreA subunit